MEIPKRIRQIADRLRQGKGVRQLPVRDFLWLFGAERRGARQIEEIKSILDHLNIETSPSFQTAWIDERIAIRLKPGHTEAGHEQDLIGSEAPEVDDQESDENLLDESSASKEIGLGLAEDAATSITLSSPELIMEKRTLDDPTFRIGSLDAANKKPVVVNQGDTLKKAVTIMFRSDFSQLPVMQSEREIKGVITWKSIAIKLALLETRSEFVRDYFDDAEVVEADRTMFEVIPYITRSGYVLVRHSDRTIKGPVTASDLAVHLQTLTEPFLLLREIELHVRNLIGSKIDRAGFALLSQAPVSSRAPQSVADLTFGQYVRLIQHPEVWAKLQVQYDKGVLTELLESVRTIRNDVMHFDPDPMTSEALNTLKEAVRFMQDLHILYS